MYWKSSTPAGESADVSSAVFPDFRSGPAPGSMSALQINPGCRGADRRVLVGLLSGMIGCDR